MAEHTEEAMVPNVVFFYLNAHDTMLEMCVSWHVSLTTVSQLALRNASIEAPAKGDSPTTLRGGARYQPFTLPS